MKDVRKDILLAETDPHLVNLEADSGWMKVAGKDPVDCLTRHGDRYAMLHIISKTSPTRSPR